MKLSRFIAHCNQPAILVEFGFLVAIASLINLWIPKSGVSWSDWKSALVLIFLAPICEEIFFRQWVQNFFEAKKYLQLVFFGCTLPNFLTSITFALVHISTHPIYLFIGYFIVSLVLGRMKEKTDSLIFSILLHSYFNSLSVLTEH